MTSCKLGGKLLKQALHKLSAWKQVIIPIATNRNTCLAVCAGCCP